jgi:NAD(P)-dependent dehydrogenase (short-subunit alcohol dehydrogenase family)
MAKKRVETEPASETGQSPATKAQAMRDALASDPKGMPKDIAERLSAEGWNVTAKEVSQAKFLLKARKKKGKKKAAAKVAEAVPAAAVPADLVSVAALQKAKKLVHELGGLGEAKQALAALAQLLD